MCKRSVDIWGHLYHVLSVNSLIAPIRGPNSGNRNLQVLSGALKGERERERERFAGNILKMAPIILCFRAYLEAERMLVNIVVVEWFLLDNFKMVARKLNYIASFTSIKKHFNKT